MRNFTIQKLALTLLGSIAIAACSVATELGTPRTAYPSKTKTGEQTGEKELTIEFWYRTARTDFKEEKRITSDSVLYTGDQYKIRFTAKTDGYLRILNEDNHGNKVDLLEEAGVPKEIRAGQTYEYPKDGDSYTLDEHTGKEKVTWWVSSTPDEISGRNKPKKMRTANIQPTKTGVNNVSCDSSSCGGTIEFPHR